MRKLIVGSIPLALTAAMLLGGTNTVHAQGMGGGGGGGMGGGGGGLGGGGSGSSGLGSLGGSTGTGANTFSGATGTGGNGGTGAATTYGTGAPTLGYFASPLSYGLGGNNAIASSSASASSSTSSGFGSSSGSYGGSGGSSSSTSNGGFTNVQAPAAVAFGQAMFNVQPTSTFTQPTASTLSSNGGGGGLGGSGSASIRSTTVTPQTAPNRPTYTTYLGFTPDPVPVAQVSTDLKNALASSSEWAKDNNKPVQVVVDGSVAVLRGTVASDHDRELAERLAAMTPGVREVRNDLKVSSPSPSTSVSLGTSSR